MKKIALIFGFIFLLTGANAQFFFIKVLDENQLPLPYAGIYNLSAKNGFVSNEEGILTGDFATFQPTDSVVFSHIGYSDFRCVFADVVKQKYVITLSSKSYDLTEMVVKPITAIAYLRNALSLLPENYPTDYTKTTMLFKDYSKRSGEKMHYYYAKYDLFLDSYQDSIVGFSKVINIEKYRKKGGLTASMEPNNLQEFISLKKVFSEKELGEHKYSFAGETNLDNKKIQVIKFVNIPKRKNEFALVKGKIFIEEDSKAIRYIEYDVKNEKAKRFMLVAKVDSMHINVKIYFTKVNDKYVFDYATQQTYATGSFFGKNETLDYHTFMKSTNTQVHFPASAVTKTKEIAGFKKIKEKDISELKIEPQMQ